MPLARADGDLEPPEDNERRSVPADMQDEAGKNRLSEVSEDAVVEASQRDEEKVGWRDVTAARKMDKDEHRGCEQDGEYRTIAALDWSL
jgi:hypothetical protein